MAIVRLRETVVLDKTFSLCFLTLNTQRQTLYFIAIRQFHPFLKLEYMLQSDCSVVALNYECAFQILKVHL